MVQHGCRGASPSFPSAVSPGSWKTASSRGVVTKSDNSLLWSSVPAHRGPVIYSVLDLSVEDHPVPAPLIRAWGLPGDLDPWAYLEAGPVFPQLLSSRSEVCPVLVERGLPLTSWWNIQSRFLVFFLSFKNSQLLDTGRSWRDREKKNV